MSVSNNKITAGICSVKQKVNCPNCDQAYKVSAKQAGTHAACRKCGQGFTIEMQKDETLIVKASTADDQNDRGGRDEEKGKSGTGTSQPAQPHESPPRTRREPSLSASRPTKPAVARFTLGPGKKIGPYQIRQELGRGGMGIVWEAYDPVLQRKVAIKTLPSELTRDKQRLQRFLREARSAAKLHHTHVAAVFQAGVEQGLAYIAMEHVDGGSLDKVVSLGRPMDWREATRVIRDAASGLAAAHHEGLIHRDIKPANLMQTRKGVTKVVDFGLAKAQQAQSQVTQEGTVLGTPNYMSPEQWRAKELDGRSDLYSLICCYYFLLTGQAPFDTAAPGALGYLHQHELFPDPRGFVADLPDGVCHILARGAEKDAADRFQNAEELVAELDSLLESPEQSLMFPFAWSELTQPQASSVSSKKLNQAGERCERRPTALRFLLATLSAASGCDWRRRGSGDAVVRDNHVCNLRHGADHVRQRHTYSGRYAFSEPTSGGKRRGPNHTAGPTAGNRSSLAEMDGLE